MQTPGWAAGSSPQLRGLQAPSPGLRMEGSGVQGWRAETPEPGRSAARGPTGGPGVSARCWLPLAGLSLGFRPWAPRGTRARGRRVLRAGSGGLESLVLLLQREVWGAEARAAVPPLTVPLYRGEPRPGALSPCQFLLAGFEGFYEGRK